MSHNHEIHDLQWITAQWATPDDLIFRIGFNPCVVELTGDNLAEIIDESTKCLRASNHYSQMYDYDVMGSYGRGTLNAEAEGCNGSPDDAENHIHRWENMEGWELENGGNLVLFMNHWHGCSITVPLQALMDLYQKLSDAPCGYSAGFTNTDIKAQYPNFPTEDYNTFLLIFGRNRS